MGFGWPLGLASLAALLVPLIIHLARRRAERPIRVGSLRHLPANAAPRRTHLRFTEPWLLAVRILVLTVLALFIARLFLRGEPPERAPISMLVVPSTVPDDSLRIFLPAFDSILRAGAELRRTPMADLWSEIAELDATLPAGSTLAIAAPFELRLPGARPALGSSIALHRIPAPAASVPASAAPAGRTLQVVLAADSAHTVQARRVAAAFRAVAELRGDSLELVETADAPAGDAWIVWLSDADPAPGHLAAVAAGATLLTTHLPGTKARPRSISVEPLERGRVIIAPPLDAPPLDGTFPAFVARIWPDPSRLAPTEPPLRRVATSQLQPAHASTARTAAPRTEPGRALLVLAFALFLFERWLAHRPAVARA